MSAYESSTPKPSAGQADYRETRRDCELAMTRYKAEGKANEWQFASLVWAWTEVPTAPLVVCNEGREVRLVTIDVGEPSKIIQQPNETCRAYLDRCDRLPENERVNLHVRLMRPAYYSVATLCRAGSLWDTASKGAIQQWAQRLLDDNRLKVEAENASQEGNKRQERWGAISAEVKHLAQQLSLEAELKPVAPVERRPPEGLTKAQRDALEAEIAAKRAEKAAQAPTDAPEKDPFA